MKTIFQNDEACGKNPWIYENSPCYTQIEFVLKSSSPRNVMYLEFSKIEADFDAGDFSFILLNKERKEFKIPFFKNFRSINEIWDFLEKLCSDNVSQVMTLYRNNAETIIVCIKLPNNNIRFTVLNTLEYRLNNDGRHKYSYLNSKIDLDVIISKKEFIREFYTILFSLFKEHEIIAYFEPPVTNFNYWTKDSLLIKKYLGRNLHSNKLKTFPKVIYLPL